MRILVFNWRDLEHPHAGGAEVYTDAVAREWVRMGHEVTLFVSKSEGCKEREITSSGYNVIRRGSRHGVYREARKFWRDEGNESFDLVVDEVNTRPFGCPRFVKGIPVVALIHQVCREIWAYEAKWPLSWLGRYVLEPTWLWLYRDVPVVTVSESSRRSLARYGLRLIEVVPQGTSCLGSANGGVVKEVDPTFVFVGRLTANKRPEDAVSAFEVLRGHLPNARLWVIGTGPMEAQMRRCASDGVTFFGRVSDVEKRSLVARAHVLLATSVREGWGLVVTEAACVNTAACGYDVPGLRDSIGAAGGVLSASDPGSLAAAALRTYERVVSGDLIPRIAGVAPWGDVATGVIGAGHRLRRDHLDVGFIEPDPGTLGVGG